MNLLIAGTDIACSMVSIIILFAILSTKKQRKKKNIYMIIGIISLIFFSFADGISFIMDEYSGDDTIHFCLNVLSYIGADFIISAFVCYISELIRERISFSKIYERIVLIGSFLDVIFVVYGSFCGRLFIIENGKTVYGELNDYLGFIQFIVIVFFLISVDIRRKQLERKFVISIWLYFLAPLLAMIIVLINEQFTFTYMASVLSFLIVYVNIVQEDLHASILGEKIMRKASITDGLTGVLNRKAYSEYEVYTGNHYPSDLVYISMDVNGLKVVNDSLGHEAGDEIIVGAAQCMQSCLGRYGRIYRMGGDEFTVVLSVATDQITKLIDEFKNSVDNWHGKIVNNISVSLGYVLADEVQGLSLVEVASLADKRMYEAKTAFYKKSGVDRRGQADAHKALCDLYEKILKINITDNTYQIVNMNIEEQTDERGFADSISEWLISFGKAGQVHPDDLEEYHRLTDLKYVSEYFKSNKTSLHIFYRRKHGNDFKQVMMEMIPSTDYSDDNQNLFLYVKNIER